VKLTQQHIKRHPDKLSRFVEVRIYSKQWGAWWRANGAGYTTVIEQAGVYPITEAWKCVSHCGPEKKIELHSAEPATTLTKGIV
jgi:hypothetical protein